MALHDVLLTATQLAMGFSLAAACGLRAFLPVFLTGLFSRLGYLQLGHGFEWMGSTPALITFGSAVVFELLGDKIPVVDHALDAGGVVVKPLAASLLAASLFTQIDPALASVAGLISGGTMAGSVHVLKAKTRLGSTLVTAGMANPFLSLLEDAMALVATFVALLAPYVAAFVLLVVISTTAIIAYSVLPRRSSPAR